MLPPSFKRWLKQITQNRNKKRLAHSRLRYALQLDQLDQRICPVVGATANAPAVTTGTGFDGVVLLSTPTGSGTGSLLSSGRHILTAAHVIASNEDQVIDLGNPTGGTYRISFGGNTTVNIAFNASNATVRTALEGIVGVGNVQVFNGPSAGTVDYLVEFRGTFALTDVAQMTVGNDSLVGGAVTITTDTAGGISPSATLRFDMPGGVSINITSTQILPHPAYNGDVQNGNDVAIVVLPDQIANSQLIAPLGAERYNLFTGSNEVGQVYNVVGYGRTGTGASGSVVGSHGTKRSGVNAFDADASMLNAAPVSHQAPVGGTALAWDFDNGLTANDAFGSIFGLNNLGLGINESNPAQGDSGGPLFIGTSIAGIVSYSDRHTNPPDVNTAVDRGFGEFGVATRVSAFQTFINNSIATFDTAAGSYHLVLDMSFQAAGNDGLDDTIEISRSGNDLRVSVNGVLDPVGYPIAKLLSFTVRGSSDGEFIDFQSDLGIQIAVDGGNGASNALQISSQSPPGGRVWNVVGADAGTVDFNTGSFDFSNIANLYGGDGSDVFAFDAASSISGFIVGGTGYDALDFSTADAQTVALLAFSAVDGFSGTASAIGAFFVDINAIAGSVAGATDSLSGLDTLSTWTHTGTTGQYRDDTSGRTLAYSNFESLNGGSGGDTFNVRSTVSSLDIDGGGDSDSVNVGSLAPTTSGGLLTGITGQLTLSNVGNAITLDDSGDAANRTSVLLDTVVVGADTFGRLQNLGNTGAIRWLTSGSEIETVNVKGGSGAKTIVVDQTNPPAADFVTNFNTGTGVDTVSVRATVSTLNVEGQNGADLVTIGSLTNSLDGILAPVTIRNANNYTTLTIRDDGNAAGTTAAAPAILDTFTSGNEVFGRLTGLHNTGAIAWLRNARGIRQVDVFGSAQGNAYVVNQIDSPSTDYVTTLDTGAGNDTVNVLATTNSLVVQGQAGADRVNVGSAAPSVGGDLTGIKASVQIQNALDLTAVSIDASGDFVNRTATVDTPLLGTSAFGQLTGLGNTGAIRWQTSIRDVSAVTINAGAGNDVFNVNASRAASSAFLTTINGGEGADILNVNAMSARNGFTLNGQGGDDVFNVRAVPAATAVLRINGGSELDALTLPNRSNDWNITGADSGNVAGVVTSYVSIENLTGGTLQDVFRFGASGSVTGLITGRGGRDFLDYSAVRSSIFVDLTAGVASRTGGVGGVQNVIGSAGGGDYLAGGASGSVLVGHGAGNTLVGRAGRNVLIGGIGRNLLHGGSGGDIAIAGRTSYDANPVALAALHAEMQSARTYAARLANLRRGGGLAAGYKLVLNRTVFVSSTPPPSPRYGYGGGNLQSTIVAHAAGQEWYFTYYASIVIGKKNNELVN